MVHCHSVAAGVGPDDADGGDGSALEHVAGVQLGEGDVGVDVGLLVVGGEDSFGVGDKGQSVGSAEGGDDTAILIALVAEDGLI